MIDICNAESFGLGFLSKITFRKSGEADSNGLLADVDIAFEIRSTDDAEVAEDVLPGSGAAWKAKATGEESKNRISKMYQRMFVWGDIGNPQQTVYEGKCQVKSVSLSSNAKMMVVQYRLRLFDIDEKQAGALCMLLGEMTEVEFRQLQGELPFKSSNSSKMVEIATIKMHDGEIGFGKVVSWDDAEVRIDDFGVVNDIHPDDVVAVVKLKFDATTIRLLDDYKRMTLTNMAQPSWQHLLLALGERFAVENPVGDDDYWTLTEQMVQTAVASSIERVGEA